MEDTKSTLKKVYALSEDDNTKNAMLMSRLDEQSQLICILKQRADDVLVRCQALEKMNTELESLIDDVKTQLKHEKKKCAQLEDRFNDLAANHQEMIKFKDEYKFENAKLREHNEQLRNENKGLFCKALQEKEEKIAQLSDELKQLSKKYNLLVHEYEKALKTFEENEKKLLECHGNEENILKGKIELLKKKLRDAEERYSETNVKLKEVKEKQESDGVKLELKLQKLCKEKDELLELCMERGKIIQEKQTDILVLEEKCKMAETAKRKAEERFEQEACAVNTNLKVKELQRQLVDSEQDYINLKKEFEAYKTHSMDLLTKEKELNAKLRHLIR
ncbi:coiled-coil domain-containing protein 89-like [Protopterus annectens]|uniref:coiled-coil domain-containing protein 89-like n=1 Tax=Protopterus annectens TaxID=7888 RepID=UPI001CFC05E1|nr:coiled-coil domain-containing protein 89-like [Protopterus annectens]